MEKNAQMKEHKGNIREIKDFRQEEFDAVLKLLPRLGAEVKLPSEAHYRQIIASENSHLFLLEVENGEIAGMLTIGKYFSPTGLKVWIEDVVVDETHAGKGFGRQLMLHALDYAEKFGARNIELTSRPARVAANKLYQSLGFELQKTNKYRFVIKRA